MSFVADYPITKSKLDELLEQILAGENITSLWMPHSARTDFAIKLQSKTGIVNELSDVEFFILDLSLSPEFLLKKFDQIQAEIKATIQKGKQATLILDNFDSHNIEFVKYIFSLRHELPPRKLTFFVLAFESEFYAKRSDKTDVSLIYNTIIKVPYFTWTETSEWIGNKYNLTVKKQMFEFCGGIVGLLANFDRGMKRYGSVEQVIKSEQMKNTIEHLWGRFSDRERHILKSIARFGNVPPYTFELNYMREHNLLTADNKIIGDWVKLVAGQDQEATIEIKNGQLIWDGVTLNDLFTDKELDVLLALLNTPNHLSRDTISKIMWGGKAAESYSDWAIDQLFSRLRKKLDSVGLGGEKIVTLKGKGFMIVNLKVV